MNDWTRVTCGLTLRRNVASWGGARERGPDREHRVGAADGFVVLYKSRSPKVYAATYNSIKKKIKRSSKQTLMYSWQNIDKSDGWIYTLVIWNRGFQYFICHRTSNMIILMWDPKSEMYENFFSVHYSKLLYYWYMYMFVYLIVYFLMQILFIRIYFKLNCLLTYFILHCFSLNIHHSPRSLPLCIYAF